MDWGGVMTTNLFESFAAFCVAEELAPETVRNAFRSDPVSRRLLEDFECGRLANEDFESRFGAVLGVREPAGLIGRLFGGMGVDEDMRAAVAGYRTAGIRTGLLSNSWGALNYDFELLGELFDVLVISGDLNVRKPEPAIYEIAIERMGLPASELVFVDDLPGNLKPARALGIHTIVHTDAASTIAALEEVFGASNVPR
jgi:epoxide hydrolase-like predicted phosphatase